MAFKELLMSEVIQSEALINLLDQKGIISKKELLEEMKRVQAILPRSERTGKKDEQNNQGRSPRHSQKQYRLVIPDRNNRQMERRVAGLWSG
jgi:hypothetical protein